MSICYKVKQVIVICIIASCGHSGAAEGCGGLITQDRGNLQIGASHKMCLWVISLQTTTSMRVKLSPVMTTRILIVPTQNFSINKLQSRWISGLEDAVDFEVSILAIIVPHGTEKSNLSWEGIHVGDDSRVSLSTKFVNNSYGALRWKHEQDGLEEIFWAFQLGMAGKLNWKLDTLLPACGIQDPCDSVSFVVLEVTPYGRISEIEKSCEGFSEGSLILKQGVQLLLIVGVNSPVEATTSFEVAWESGEKITENVDGIIAGCDEGNDNGIFLIPFNSSQAQKVQSESVDGIAFDWTSSRVYWLQDHVGIRRANLDGTEPEILLADRSSVFGGIAIEPISGNLYYGDQSSAAIRVCNNDAKKCSLVLSSDDLPDVMDIEIHGSKGFIFWSIANEKIVRANLDGSNSTIILELDTVQGIGLDEYEDRVYWGSVHGIGSCDLNGDGFRILPNVNSDVLDVAIQNDEVYYSIDNQRGINVISKQGANLTLVSNLTENAWHIAVFSTRIQKFVFNPCEESNCAHLCILTSPTSYRCVCPDGEKIDKDEKTCIV